MVIITFYYVPFIFPYLGSKTQRRTRTYFQNDKLPAHTEKMWSCIECLVATKSSDLQSTFS